MTGFKIVTCARAAGLLVPLLWLVGCVEYTIETTLNADGTGVRSERMVVDEIEDSDLNVSYSDFADVMFVTENRGWKHSTEEDGDDTLHVFERDTRVRDLAGWSGLSDGVRIAGTRSANGETTVGYVSLVDVQFRNTVNVEIGEVGEYTTYSYRETFYWENLYDVLVEYFVETFMATVDARYPDLTPGQRGELAGLVRGGLWSAMDQGLLDASDEKEQELVSRLIDRTAPEAAKIVRQSYSDVEAESFRSMLRHHIDDEDDELGDFINRELPGVQLAGNSEIIFRLNMPGRVTTSNSDERDGGTLTWEFGPWHAATKLEIFAESVVRE
jgi:hypothetical protein